ncbi:NUDIX domain-containing protein [Ideonella sp. 4Y16]|uniref:NUDIX domain-containing protein n=1 Tax=Ideonella alba TaxID=2824118 RepID=UPI001B36A7D2|nr:NUDIX domain-containing protein [Ideonella alba]MBQ0943579.1 NUDIX domain-containing protein [Ideonella alba]
MQHRISAGVIVEHDGRLLLVRHVKPGAYDFWVAPGGGVKGTESLEEAAAREAREETGLEVHVGRLLYVEEFFNPECRHVKFWFAARFMGGQLNWSHPDAVAEHITQAAWHELDALSGLTVFPSFLTTRYASDRAAGFQQPVRLALREMTFW